MTNRLAYFEAVGEIISGVWRYEVWALLGWQDIKRRYRRSVLGPFWMTISTGITILALGILYAQLFKQPLGQYLPFVAVGLVVWTLISSLVIDACDAFVSSEHMIKQVRLPLSTYVCRNVFRHLLIFAHNAIILIIVVLLCWNGLHWQVALIPLALLLIAANGIWVGILLGILAARFRDIPLLVQSFVQLVFFLTPIMWKPELLSERPALVNYNPFFHFIEIIRAPLLGVPASFSSWLTVVTTGIVGTAAAVSIFAAYRNRVAYWV